jgi:hypothetical protein
MHAAGKRSVVYTVRAEELKRNDFGQPVQLTSAREDEVNWRYSSAGSVLTESFAWEAVKELESVKLKNLRC